MAGCNNTQKKVSEPVSCTSFATIALYETATWLLDVRLALFILNIVKFSMEISTISL